MAFSPPVMMISKRILYGIAAGISVVGGENAIQRPEADYSKMIERGGRCRSLLLQP